MLPPFPDNDFMLREATGGWNVAQSLISTGGAGHIHVEHTHKSADALQLELKDLEKKQPPPSAPGLPITACCMVGDPKVLSPLQVDEAKRKGLPSGGTNRRPGLQGHLTPPGNQLSPQLPTLKVNRKKQHTPVPRIYRCGAESTLSFY